MSSDGDNSDVDDLEEFVNELRSLDMDVINAYRLMQFSLLHQVLMDLSNGFSSFNDNQLKTIDLEKSSDCNICIDQKKKFKELPCCNNKICVECSTSWFQKNPTCPFCRRDLNDFIIDE
jgi:hypothetical protein